MHGNDNHEAFQLTIDKQLKILTLDLVYQAMAWHTEQDKCQYPMAIFMAVDGSGLENL